MSVGAVADTHILVAWHSEPESLWSEHRRFLERTVQRGLCIGVSAITPFEISLLIRQGRIKLKWTIEELFDRLRADPSIQLLPITWEIAAEAGALHTLRDPGDRIIAATARIHGLKLVTADTRIMESGLVSIVE